MPDVPTIRKKLAQGKSIAEIAEAAGVTRQAVYKKLRMEEQKKAPTAGGHIPTDLRAFGNVSVDPETGYAVTVIGRNKLVVGRMGDERVTEFVKYHMEMLGMRQGCDKRNVPDLYQRFFKYLSYCSEHGIVPNNANAYFAIGILKQDISQWRKGAGSPEQKEFADTVAAFFASVHEQGATDGVLNPISAMFWQKAYDNLVEASKLEVIQEDPLGDKRSAEEIARSYADVELPD